MLCRVKIMKTVVSGYIIQTLIQNLKEADKKRG